MKNIDFFIKRLVSPIFTIITPSNNHFERSTAAFFRMMKKSDYIRITCNGIRDESINAKANAIHKYAIMPSTEMVTVQANGDDDNIHVIVDICCSDLLSQYTSISESDIGSLGNLNLVADEFWMAILLTCRHRAISGSYFPVGLMNSFSKFLSSAKISVIGEANFLRAMIECLGEIELEEKIN